MARAATRTTSARSPDVRRRDRPDAATHADDDEHREPVEREARVAEPVEPPADDGVLPEHRPQLQPGPGEHVPRQHDEGHDGDEAQRPERTARRPASTASAVSTRDDDGQDDA